MGNGAVIGAAAVVASDVPSFAIMVGNPARCLRKRFDESTIERLLQIRWWDWKPEDLYKYQDLLTLSPQEFVAAVDKLPGEELAAMYEADPDGVDRAYRANAQAPADAQPVNIDAEIGMVKTSRFKSVARQITPPILYAALYRLTR